MEQEGDSLCCSDMKTFRPDVVSVLLQRGSVYSDCSRLEKKQTNHEAECFFAVGMAVVPVLMSRASPPSVQVAVQWHQQAQGIRAPHAAGQPQWLLLDQGIRDTKR